MKLSNRFYMDTINAKQTSAGLNSDFFYKGLKLPDGWYQVKCFGPITNPEFLLKVDNEN